MKNKGKTSSGKLQAVALDQASLKPMNEKKKSRVPLLVLILLVTAMVYSNSLRNGFVQWDDGEYVFNNPDIRQLNGESLHKFFTDFYLKMYSPVTLISYALDYRISQLEPAAYHRTNLIVHLLNVSLVFYFICLLTERTWIAGISALFFGIHPLHVESVAWISERKDLLYSLFYLCSLVTYILYRKKGSRYKNYFLAILFFILSLLSKSAAVTLPVILILIDYYLGKKLTLKNHLDKIPFFLLSIVFGILSLLSQRVIGSDLDFATGYTILDRFSLGAYSLAFYIIKSILPFRLSALHPMPLKPNGLLPMKYYISSIAFLAFGWVLIRTFRSKADETFKKDILFGLLFFLFTISLVLFIPVGQAVVAERYTYIPYIGLFLILGSLYLHLKNKIVPFFPKVEYWYSVGLLALAVFCACSTYGRNAVWKDTLSLFTDVIEKNPDAGLAYNNRGNVRKGQNDFAGAMADYNRAIELKYTDAFLNRGILRNGIKDYKNAIEDFNQALPMKSHREKVYYNRGIARLSLGDFKGAEEDFGKAIEIDPQYSSAYNNRGFVRYQKLLDFNGAISDFDIAIRLDPAASDIYYNRGNAKFRSGDFAGALHDYDKALQIAPGYAEAYLNKGIAFLKLKNIESACLNWKKAAGLGAKPAAELIGVYCR